MSLMSKQPHVTFVILNWNQPRLTAECLQSISEQDYDNYHVIVVDNGSSDGSAALLAQDFAWTEMIRLDQNVGYGMGNNIGIEHALNSSTDYVFLLNNDTQVDGGMLSTLVDVAESNPALGIVGPTMLYFDSPDLIWSGENYVRWKSGYVECRGMGKQYSYNDSERNKYLYVDHIDTCAALIKRAVFQEIGLLDTRYFINFDDLDFDLRAKRAGFKIAYVPRARMWHKVSLTMGLASPATTYYMTRNSLLLFREHADGLAKYSATASIVARTIRTIAAWSLKTQYQSEQYRRKRDANLYAMRDFILGRYGRMGEDVTRACYGTL